MVVNYQNTVIYKITCNDTSVTDMYIGYTTNIIDRIKVHSRVSRNPKNKSHNQKTYRTIREYGGWNNWKVVIIEKFPCGNKFEARNREKMWFERLNPSLNINK